ncbi:MAG: DUF3891 family protein, partial [Candidatus Methylomirabilales bacterium]
SDDMIRRPYHDGWVLIRQGDHAALSGALMARWGNTTFFSPTPREEVLFGIAEHDNGWDDWDRVPEIHTETGYPLQFTELTSDAYSAIWRRGVAYHRKKHPYASLLITLHTAYLARSRLERLRGEEYGFSVEETASLEAFVAEIEKIRVELTDELRARGEGKSDQLEAEIRANFRLLQIGDLVSLKFCSGLSEPFTIDLVPAQVMGSSHSVTFVPVSDDTIALCPYPFSEPDVAVAVPGRILRREVFASNQELRDHLLRADSISLSLRIIPA